MKLIDWLVETETGYNSLLQEMYPVEKIEREVRRIISTSDLANDYDQRFNMGKDRAELLVCM